MLQTYAVAFWMLAFIHIKLANLFLSSSAKMHCASQDLRTQLDASEETQGMDDAVQTKAEPVACFNGSCCNMFMLDEVCTVAREFFPISQGQPTWSLDQAEAWP